VRYKFDVEGGGKLPVGSAAVSDSAGDGVPSLWREARDPEAARVWTEFIQPLAEELREQARFLSEASVVRFEHVVPSAFTDPTSAEQVRANAEAAFLTMADALARRSDPTSVQLPEGLVAGARSRAQMGFTLAPLMRAFRLAHEDVANWMRAQLDAREDSDADRDTARALCSKWLFACTDTLATLYSEVYETERRTWMRTAAAVRTDMIAAIVAGEEEDSVRASSRLAYELNRHHVALLAWIESGLDNVAGQDAIRMQIERFASAAGADSSLIEPIGTRAAMAWVSRSVPFEAAELDAATRSDGVVALAVGEPAAGLGGFRRSHLEAGHARRVSSLVGGSRRVMRYGRVELVAIATLDLDRTRCFVERALGELVADDDASRRLAATLDVYLDENCSRSRAAKRLGIHENTITYRIRQVQEIIGRPIESDALRLGAALALLPAIRQGS
jgi:DNA-binding PucR family transcriptional regulator